MIEKNTVKPQAKSTSADWFVKGALTRIGDMFDRLTGRNWKPSSSLATSELISRLKVILDAEKRDMGGKGVFVPHSIKLKMQWDKFSTDNETSLKMLHDELLVAAIDFINDNRYHTLKPLKIEIKNDYFTDGVKLAAGFDEADEEEAELKVTMPQAKVEDILPTAESVVIDPLLQIFQAEFTASGKPRLVELKFTPGKRISVGRTRENGLTIEDGEVSKIHATLFLNQENKLLIADTGSTNGTFINGQRIAYGRAFPVAEGDKLSFGTVDVFLRNVPQTTDFEPAANYPIDENKAENLPQNQRLLEANKTPATEAFDNAGNMREFENTIPINRE